MDELDAALSHRLRAALDDAGVRREDFAQRMTGLGFRWSGNTVTQVVTGRRALSLLEVAGVCDLLGQSLADLLPRREFGLHSGSVSTDDVVAALLHGRSDWRAHRQGELTPDEQALYDRYFPAEHSEVTVKVARRLGVQPAKVMDAATELWGHSIGMERDRRVPAIEGETRRALQARRGHVTRTLVADLSAFFADAGSND